MVPAPRAMAIVMACVITVAGGSAAPSPAASQTGPLLLQGAYSFTPTTWDPNKSIAVEYYFLVNMYEQLVFPQPDGTLTPGLASSWESSTDGRTWTFHLREGVKFHDGEPLTSDAVKRSIERTVELGPAGFIWEPLESIDTPDPLTVVMNLEYATQMDLRASAGWGAWIVSPKALDAAGQNPDYFEAGLEAGTGPYTMESYTPDAEAVFRKFEDYWGGWDGLHFDTVVASITPESTIQLQKLLGGEAEIVQSIPPETMPTLQSNPDVTVLGPFTTWNTQSLSFNTLRSPLDNKLVRQALSYAIPYDDIIEVGFNGLATQPHTSVPDNVFPYDPSVYL
jgi:peptide/nickel transport system substrate-binding protein